MRAWEERKFDPSLPVFARKKLVADGQTYLPKQEIDWQARGMPMRRIRQMFDANYVTQPQAPLYPQERAS